MNLCLAVVKLNDFLYEDLNRVNQRGIYPVVFKTCTVISLHKTFTSIYIMF